MPARNTQTSMNYRVYVADRDTGAESTLSIVAESPDEAGEQAYSQGWLVTRVERAHAPQTQTRGTKPSTHIAAGIFKGVWMVAGSVALLALLAIGGLFVLDAITRPDAAEVESIRQSIREYGYTSVEYDEFDDETTFSTYISSNGNTLSISKTMPGEADSAPFQSHVSVTLLYGNDVGSSPDRLVLLIDGERIEPSGNGSLSGFWSVRTSDLAKILDAEAVKVRVGLYDFTMTEEQKEAIRELMTYLDPISGG